MKRQHIAIVPTIITTVLVTVSLLLNVSLAEEVVYLKPAKPCKVTVYPAPDVAPLSEKLTCAEKAILLERKGQFARVQMGENIIVWVADKNLTGNTPAEYEVLRLLKYQKKIETELANLNKQVNRLSEKSSKLIDALMAAEAAKKAGER